MVIFTDAWKTRDHTGIIYAVDKDYIYTYEGNSGNMARKRSYPIKSAYIYGYAELDLGASAEREDASGIARFQRWLGVEDDGVYGPITKAAAIKAHQKAVNEQYGLSIAEDGDWGSETYYATRNVQRDDWGDGSPYTCGTDHPGDRDRPGHYGTGARRCDQHTGDDRPGGHVPFWRGIPADHSFHV